MALKDLFSDIASAIREKDGTSDPIIAEDFPSHIRAITSQSGEVQLESIAITNPPVRTKYAQGDTFDPEGMEVYATYSNGQSVLISNNSLTFSPSEALDPSISSITINYKWGSNTASASQQVSVSSARIFGVMWDYSNPSTKLTRLSPEADPYGYVTAKVKSEPRPAIGNMDGHSPFDAYMPWSGMEEYNIISYAPRYIRGTPDFSRTKYDTMVYIPEFWYRCIDDTTSQKRYWYISDKSFSNMKKHPGSGRYISRYNISSDYTSVSGVTPISNVSLSAAKTQVANKKGSRWGLYNYEIYCAIIILYLIEYADFNSQEKLAEGISGSGSRGIAGLTDNMSYHTGRVNTTNNLSQMQYRHIEDLWGSYWDVVDNINVSNYAVSIGNNTTGMSFSNSSGSPIRLSPDFLPDYDWAFIPSSVIGGSNSTYIPDSIFVNSGSDNTLLVGGHDGYGNQAGLFCTYLYSKEKGTNDSSHRLSFV